MSSQILGFSSKEYYAFYQKVQLLLFEYDLSKITFDKFFENAEVMEPLPDGGNSNFYMLKYSALYWDVSKDWSGAIAQIEKEKVYKAFSANPCVKSAFRVYESLPVPANWTAEYRESSIETNKEFHKSAGMEDYFEVWLENQKSKWPVKMDFYRFCGFVAINYAVYQYEFLKQSDLRAKQKTPAEIRDQLMGSKKNKGQGALPQLIDNINEGNGLLDSNENMELLYLLHKLKNQVTDEHNNNVNPVFDKRLTRPEKRFVVRIASRLISEMELDIDSESEVELLVYHLMMNIVHHVEPKVEPNFDNSLRKEITRRMAVFYEHRDAIRRSWQVSDYMNAKPLLDLFP